LNRIYARLQTLADKARRDAVCSSRASGNRSKVGKDIPDLDIDSEHFGYLGDTEFGDGDETTDLNGDNGGDENQGEPSV
jgi:hypothetical protein